jgi:hypothetical protein
VIVKQNPINISIIKDIIGEVGPIQYQRGKEFIIYAIKEKIYIMKEILMDNLMVKAMLYVTLDNGNTKDRLSMAKHRAKGK